MIIISKCFDLHAFFASTRILKFTLAYQNVVMILSRTTIVVHNRDQPEIYENPLIERMIMDLMGHIEKQT